LNPEYGTAGPTFVPSLAGVPTGVAGSSTNIKVVAVNAYKTDSGPLWATGTNTNTITLNFVGAGGGGGGGGGSGFAGWGGGLAGCRHRGLVQRPPAVRLRRERLLQRGGKPDQLWFGGLRARERGNEFLPDLDRGGADG
jgi:hypothetical protein